MYKRKLIIAILCVVMVVFVGCSNPADLANKGDITVVRAENGMVKGTAEEDVVVFKGIPFAKPPVGDLRFAPPQPTENWEGTLDCSQFKAEPRQINKKGEIEGDEDCLYLNVWAPKSALENKDEKLPVLVFIHGGGYATGSAFDEKYDGTAFAKDGVICVTVEYRLNALGFLTVEEMEKESGYGSNLGVLDQIQSLKWIEENIENFGGDSNNVTISGESAGSMSVSTLIMSPMAKGLFNQAIMESGSLFGEPILGGYASGDEKSAIESGKVFMEKVGASNLEELRKIDVDTLVRTSAFSMDMVHPSPLSFMPVFDGKVIETTPYERLKNGNYNDVKILTGYNTDEGTLFVGEGISEADYENYVKIIFGDKASAVLERFPVDEAHTPTDRARQIVKMGFQIGCKTFGDAQSDNGKDVYVYNFDYHLPQMDEIGLGVMHAEELLFVFDTFPEAIELPEDGRKMIDQVHNYWVSFVKSGNPNGENGTEIWPKYTKEQQQILQINSNSKVIPLEEKEAVDFFTELMWEQ